MKRVALVLALLALGLAVPVAVLVSRALASAAIEEENRHRLVAERAFDEMEDALSRFLAAEEARAFDSYRFYPDGSPPRQSPLAGPPAHAFVVGYFQIDPDGSLHTPRIPRALDTALARGDFSPSDETTRLRETLESAWRRAEPARLRAERGRLNEADALEEAAPHGQPEPQPEKKSAGLDSYDVHRSLNVASKRRKERQQKVAQVPRRALASVVAPSFSPASATASLTSAKAFRQAEAPVRVALDPMLGRVVPEQRLLLVRTVVADARGYRQGLLVDWNLLGDWLHEQIVAASGLGSANARVHFIPSHAISPTLPVQPDEAGVRSFRHDFAEPFDAFAVELLLPTLPGGRGTGTIHALALLLALVAAVGLFAVYRMVAVVVHFAERRSRFAASVSHELKTPLTSIRMYAEMLRDGLVPSEEKRSEYYHTITDESERLSRLIDNVLDFSRLERGEYRPDIRTADLRPVLREAVDKLEPHLTRHGFRVRFDEGDDVPQVAFDPDAVTQIVFNLIDNSVKYAADANDREIVISCAGDERGAEISVRDFGPGVPDHALASIFEPFHRHAAAEPGRATRGTGIGLALVKELAESLHGSASAENAEAGGLKVTVRLPRRPPPAPSA